MQSFLWKVSLYKFLDAFKLIIALFTLLFQQNGLDVFQISFLIAIWSATQMVLEIPMGVIADKYPRRNVLIAATILLAIGFVLWIKGGFLLYALGMVLWGVRNALTSGTAEAFVYDELKSFGKEQEYGKINGRLESVTQLGYMFSAILGGLIGAQSFNWVLILTIGTSILAVLVLFTIRPVKPVRLTSESKYLSILKQALKEIKSSKAILTIIIFISLIFGISGAADEYWPLIFNNLGVNTLLIGSLMALEFGVFGLAGVGFQYVEKIEFKYWDLLLVTISGILFFIFGVSNSLVLLPLVFIGSFLLKLALIKLDTDLQHKVGSGQRATILSIKSVTFEIVYLTALLFFGFISTKLGVNSIVYIWGALIMFFTAIFMRRLKSYV